MHAFVIPLVLDNTRFEIHLNEYYTPYGIRYFVFARHPDGRASSFTMEMKNQAWNIINAPRVPELFMNNEKKISDAIIHHETNET